MEHRVVAHHSVSLVRVMVLEVERITNMSCHAGVSLTQASHVHEPARRSYVASAS